MPSDKPRPAKAGESPGEGQPPEAKGVVGFGRPKTARLSRHTCQAALADVAKTSNQAI